MFSGLQLAPVNAHVIELLEAACVACIATWGSVRRVPTWQDVEHLTRVPAFNKGLIAQIDDPHEHLFTALFTNETGNHIVFPGGTTGGTRSLEGVSAVLASGRHDFEPTLLAQLSNLINGALKLSNHVAQQAGLIGPTLPAGWHRTSTERPSGIPLITVVPTDELDRLADACSISVSILQQLLTEEEIYTVKIWLTATLSEIQTALKHRPTEVLKRMPLLVQEDQWLLLAPHSLLAATTRAALRLIQDTQACGIFDKHYAALQNSLIQVMMARLGCEPLKLIPQQGNSTPTLWYSLDTDKIISVTNLVQPSADVDTKSYVGNWQVKLRSALPESPGIGTVPHVLHLMVVSDLGDSYSVAFPSGWAHTTLFALRPDDLELLAAAYNGDSTILWRLLQSHLALKKAARCQFFNPIDEIAFLAKVDFPRSFPFPKKALVMINGEVGATWRRKIQLEHRQHAVPWIDGRTLIMVERHQYLRPTLYTPIIPIWNKQHVFVEQEEQQIWVLEVDTKNGDSEIVIDRSSHWTGNNRNTLALGYVLPDLVQAVAVWLTHLLPALDLNIPEKSTVTVIYVGLQNHQQPCLAAVNWKVRAINLTISPAFELLLRHADNRAERELVRVLATALRRLNGKLIEMQFISQTVDMVAPLGDKRLFMRYESFQDAQLDPRGLVPVRYARPVEQHEWAVYVGKELAKQHGWKLGRTLPVESRIAIEANDLLYKELQNRLRLLDGELLLSLLLEHYEAARFDQQQLITSRISRELMFVESTKPFDPAAEGTTVALRFLLEVIAAKLPTGSDLPSLTGLDELLGLVLNMIHYGYAGDAIKYGVGNVQVELESDGSLTMEAEDYQRTMLLLRDFARKEGAIRANQERYEQAETQNKPTAGKATPLDTDHWALQLLDLACQALYQVSSVQLMRFMVGALNIGDRHEGGVIIMPLEQFRLEIQTDTGWTPEMILLVMDALSLQERNEFLIPPEGFLRSEVLPWQFNRAFSLLKRPFILTTLKGVPHIAWGNRALEGARQYWLEDQLFAGRLHPGPHGIAGAKEAARAMGEINRRRGVAFNTEVVQILQGAGYHVRDNVKKFGKLRLQEGGETLGDIDVLAWDEQRKRMLILECKAYAPARTPLELHTQLQELVHGKPRAGKLPERPLLQKHLRRATFVEAHLPEILEYLGIEETGDWEVCTAYVMSNLPNELLKEQASYPVLYLDELIQFARK